jgi:hypothetical protein
MQNILFLFLLCPFWIQASICYFHPPSEWECVAPKNISEHIQVGFLGKGKTDFRPSLNLAIEEVDLSLKAYVKVVRDIHEIEMNVPWRDLGEFNFRGGKGRLGEITSQSPFGEVKMLQGILVKDGFAYILTGAALRDDFAENRGVFLKALRSLTLISDLFSPNFNMENRENLKPRFDQYLSLESEEKRQQEWSSLQKIVAEQHTSLGTHWHYLVLKEGYQNIFPSDTGQKPSPQ